MKVISLRISNFAGILEADIRPGKVTILSGRNRAGKTSILNAVRVCLEGGDPTMIHQGTDRAEIVVDLEEIRVARRITAAGQRVDVTNAEGFGRTKAPQAYLSSLLGATQFNPMEFHRAKKADRTKMLLEAIAKKVTFDDIVEITGEVVPGIPKEGPALVMFDLVRRHYYALRAAKNKELVNRRELARTARAKVPEGYIINATAEREGAMRKARDGARNDVSRLEAEKKSAERAAETRTKLSDRIAKNERIAEDGRKELEKMKEPDIETLRQKVEQLRALLEEAEGRLEAAVRQVREITDIRASIVEMERTVASDKETLAALPGAFDEAPLVEAWEVLSRMASEETAIAEVRALNQLVEDAESAESARDALQTEADALDGMVIKFRDDLPAQVLREAKLPIEGLKIDGDDITVGGIPIDQLSGAEKMELALSIVRALAESAPLKLICIDGVEQLDEDSLAAFERQAHGDGFQYFVSRVGSPREGEIEIREGKVAAG
jgi:DNA repair exonuclease SbcCD ATPase subunit